MTDTKMTKTAGEHFVCSISARVNWAPALTRDGIAHTDILAVGTELPDRPTIEIQVKTANETGNGLTGHSMTKRNSWRSRPGNGSCSSYSRHH